MQLRVGIERGEVEASGGGLGSSKFQSSEKKVYSRKIEKEITT